MLRTYGSGAAESGLPVTLCTSSGANAWQGYSETGTLTLTTDGHRYRLTSARGHGFDVYTTFRRKVSEFCAWIGGWVLRFGFKQLYQAMVKFDAIWRGARTNPAADPFQRWAVALAKQRDADVIVTGHTHIGVTAEHGDRLFLNSGSCSEGRLSYLSLDTKAGDYRLNTGI